MNPIYTFSKRGSVMKSNNNKCVVLKAIYIISNIDNATKSEFKIGKHSGSIQKLISRYAVYFVRPIIFYFAFVDNGDIIETEVLNRLDKYRLIKDHGLDRKSI